MSDSEHGQVTRSAAEIYEDFFLPARLQQWAGRVASAARLEAGDRVPDAACGTNVWKFLNPYPWNWDAE